MCSSLICPSSKILPLIRSKPMRNSIISLFYRGVWIIVLFRNMILFILWLLFWISLIIITGVFHVIAVIPLSLWATCGGVLFTHIDGAFEPAWIVTSGRLLTDVMLPGEPQVIGFRCIDTSQPRSGIIASLSNGKVTTPYSWKCHHVAEEGWDTHNFNDQHWRQADSLGYLYVL